MNDVAPEILDKVKKQFEDAMKSDKTVANLLKKVEAKTATYSDASKYAEIAGKKLSKALTDNLSSDILPDGKMYYNIAQRILQPTLEDNHNMIADVATEVQQNLNDAAEIGLKAQRPDLNQDKIDGIINRISSTDNYDDIAWILGEPIINFSMSTVDDTVKKNVDFQGKAGLSPKIVRRSEFKCCEWCSNLAGTYTYPDVPDNIYQRHDNCRCTVDYVSAGKRTSVHTGKEGKRTYVLDKYNTYVKSDDARIKHIKEMQKTEATRKAAARQKRIDTWTKKQKSWKTAEESDRINKRIQDEKILDAKNEIKELMHLNSSKQVSIPAKVINTENLELDTDHIEQKKKI